MKITVFTPTYNRAYILEKLYRSLQRQSCRDFEWLIVDDGSSDSTGELVAQWQQEGNDFPIRYAYQENGGKCRAINHGLDLARGELFFTVDSDDYLTDDALEKVTLWESALPKAEKFCGFSANLGTSPGETPNYLFDGPWFDGTALDRYRRMNGERAMIFYTDIHRKYPYPVFPGEKFMTEAVAWNRMADDGYKIRFFNDIIWIYEYREDGLTKAGNALFCNNPRGYGLWLRERSRFLQETPVQRFRLYYGFCCELSHKLTLSQIAGYIGAPKAAIFAAFVLHRAKHFLKQ